MSNEDKCSSVEFGVQHAAFTTLRIWRRQYVDYYLLYVIQQAINQLVTDQ